MRSLCSLLGRLHTHTCLDATTSASALAHTLTTSLQLNAWLSVEGAERLTLDVLSCLGELLHTLWTASTGRQQTIQLVGEPLPNPWAGSPGSPRHGARGRTAEGPTRPGSFTPRPTPTPAVFLSIPLVAYLPVTQDAPVANLSSPPGGAAAAASAFLTEAVHLQGPYPLELCEAVRRAGRTVTLHPADMGVALEVGLRCAGLRDATEAARAVASWYRLAAVQLSSPAQLRLDALAVRTIVTYIQREWMMGLGVSEPALPGGPGAPPGVSGSGTPAAATNPPVAVAVAGTPSRSVQHSESGRSGSGRVGGSALDAVEAALRAVVLPAADPEDLGLLTRLLSQVRKESGLLQSSPWRWSSVYPSEVAMTTCICNGD